MSLKTASILFLFLFLFAILFLVSCEKDDPEPVNEEELITAVARW